MPPLQQIKARLTSLKIGARTTIGCIELLDGETKEEALGRVYPNEMARPVTVICIREEIIDPPCEASHDRIH
ncbi:MAG: hypothetical protein ABL933_17310 [Methyloglobulus sp.]|nr:hypothetical protein [Methyloglobulus sp.]